MNAEIDWKEEMNKSHREAELLRLRYGQDGCGCASTCQPFYKTIDLLIYGERVKKLGDFIFIDAGLTGADLYVPPKEHWSDDSLVYYRNGEGWGLKKDGTIVCLCDEESTNQVLRGEKDVATVKDDNQREVLERILEIRREIGYDDEQQSEPTRQTTTDKRYTRIERTRFSNSSKPNQANNRNVTQSKRITKY